MFLNHRSSKPPRTSGSPVGREADRLKGSRYAFPQAAGAREVHVLAEAGQSHHASDFYRRHCFSGRRPVLPPGPTVQRHPPIRVKIDRQLFEHRPLLRSGTW